MYVKITLYDNFNWDNYVAEIDNKIIMSHKPVKVIWDLRYFTKIPYQYFSKQIRLMYNYNHKLWDNIIDSTILISNHECYCFLNLLFKFYKPKKPVYIKKLP